MKQKTVLWILLLTMFYATACQRQDAGQAGGGERSARSGMERAGTAAAPSEAAADRDQKETAAPGYALAAAEGYQLVEGLGICGPGSPVVYQIGWPAPDGLVSGSAKARLAGAFYQDKMLVVKLTLEDAPMWENPGNDSPLADVRLYPPGMAGTGYGFSSRSTSTSCEEREDGQHRIVNCELRLDGVPFTKEDLGETFELRVDGFEEAFRFRFQEAEEAPSLEGLPGYTKIDDTAFLALGEYENQELTVSLYPFREDGYRVYPVSAEISCSMDGKTEKKECRTDSNLESPRTDLTLFSGMHPSGVWRFACQLPDDPKARDVSLVLNQLSLTSEERSGIYPIPVPEVAKEVDMEVEFADGTLYLTKAERIPDQVRTGYDEDGGEIRKPAVYLSAHARARRNDMPMRIVYGYAADRLGEDGKMDLYREGAIIPDVTEKPWQECEVKGYQIVCEPGAEEVDVLFWNPTYLLDRQFVLPVEPNVP